MPASCTRTIFATVFAVVTMGSTNHVAAHRSPAGCLINGSGASIGYVVALGVPSIQHGDEICFQVGIFNTCSGCCDATLLDTLLVLPDGSIVPITVDASVPFRDAFLCPGDPRCATASTCTIPGEIGYKYIVNHDDEHGVTGTNCPPTPASGIGEVSAYIRATGGTVHLPIHVGANLCQSIVADIDHSCWLSSDGTGCDDGDECTLTDKCLSSICVGANPVVCNASQKCHDAGTCDPLTGLCSDPFLPDDTPCGNGLYCNCGACGGSGGACPAEAAILRINRWWAYAGQSTPIEVDLDVWIAQAGSYMLAVDLDDSDNWDLFGGAYVKVDHGDSNWFDPSGVAVLGTLTFGGHKLHVRYFRAPLEPIIERIRFQLQGPQSASFDAMFVADRRGLTNAQVSSLTFRDSDGAALSIHSVQDLVHTFAPRLYFDSRENYFPQSVEKTLSDGALLRNADGDELRFEVSVNGLLSASAAIGSNESLDSLWVDLPGEGPTEAGSSDPSEPFPIYASAILKGNEIAISYYIHYGYSNWRQHGGYNDHEGDWESAFVYLRRAAGGQPFVPVKAAYSQHEKYDVTAAAEGSCLPLSGGEWADWSNLIRTRLVESQRQPGAKTHPRLYVGRGGHASYFFPEATGRIYCVPCQPFASTEYSDGKSSSAPSQSQQQVIFLPRAPDAVAEGMAWLVFPGHWGQRDLYDYPWCLGAWPADLEGDTGPLGPVFMKAQLTGGVPGRRWFDPFGWPTEGVNFTEWIPPNPAPTEQPAPAQDTSGVEVELDHLWQWSDADDRFKKPDNNTVTIDPNKPTYLLTHGWDGTLDGVAEGTACSSPTWAMSSIGCAIREAMPDANLLAWDWKVLANPNRKCDFPDEIPHNPGLLLAQRDIQRNPPNNAVLFDAWNSAVNAAVEGNKLGLALANELNKPGGTLGTELHLIGKSHGGGVMGRTAKIIKGKGRPPKSLSTLDTPKVGTINSLRWVEPGSVADDGHVAVYYYNARTRGGMGAPVQGSFANLTNLSLSEWFVPALSVGHLWISGPDDLVCPALDGWYPLSAWYHTLEFTDVAIVPSVLSPLDMPAGCFEEGSEKYKFDSVACGSTAGFIPGGEPATAGLSFTRYEPFQSAATWSGNLVEVTIGADPDDPANRVIVMHEQGDASFFKDIVWPAGSVLLTFDYLFSELRGKESLTVYLNDRIIYYDNADTTLAVGQLTLSDALYVGEVAGATAQLNFVLRTDQPEGGDFGGELVIDNVRVYGFLEHDADLDGDRDLFDFAAFQRCYCITSAVVDCPPSPDECRVFDENGDGAVNQADFCGGCMTQPPIVGLSRFFNCATCGVGCCPAEYSPDDLCDSCGPTTPPIP